MAEMLTASQGVIILCMVSQAHTVMPYIDIRDILRNLPVRNLQASGFTHALIARDFLFFSNQSVKRNHY